MKTGNHIQFVILTYHPRIEEIKKHIKTLSGYPVIVVNNTPGEKSSATKGNVTHIKSGENVGYTGGMNVGIRHALGKGAEWVILLNDDIGISKADVKLFVRFLKNAQPGIVGPFSGTLDPRRWTTIYPAKDESRLDYLSGSCLAIHKSVFDAIGLLYEPYFIYYEDVEFCVRAKRAGFPIMQINLPGIFHKDGTVFGRGSKTQEYYLARNHILFVARNAPLPVKLYEFIRLPKTLYDYRR